MNEIYARAFCVQIWLGEVAFAGETLKCIEEAQEYFFPAEVRRLFLQPHADINFSNYCHGLRARGLPTIFDMDLSPLRNLLQSPWWRRKWVIQEAVRAQRLLVVVGKAKVPFEVVMSLFERLALSGVDIAPPRLAAFEYTLTDVQANHEISYRCARVIHGLRLPYKREDAGPILLLEFIHRTKYFQCSDMRDHIYAMLGLKWQRENEEFKFHPDYNESPEATFTRFAIHMLRMPEHPLHLLFFNSELQIPTNLELPSWVPDWTRLGGGQPLKSLPENSATPLFRATKDTSFQLKLNESELILSFTGVRLDVIEANATTYINWTQFQTDFQRTGLPESLLTDYKISRWYQECKELAQSVCPNLKSELFHLTLVCGLHCSFKGDVVLFRAPNEHGKVLEHVMTSNANGVTCALKGDYDTADEHFTARNPGLILLQEVLDGFCLSRTFFTTKNGRIGQGPQYLKPGDIVCLFHGGSVPYILRPLADNTFSFVGHCFVQGVMDGEGMDLGLAEEEFRVR